MSRGTSSFVYLSFFFLLPIFQTQAQPFSNRPREIDRRDGDHLVSNYPVSKTEQRAQPTVPWQGDIPSPPPNVDHATGSMKKLGLRESLLALLGSPVFDESNTGHDFALRVPRHGKQDSSPLQSRQNSNGDLQSTLVALQMALDSLLDFLEQEYGVQVSSSTTISASVEESSRPGTTLASGQSWGQSGTQWPGTVAPTPSGPYGWHHPPWEGSWTSTSSGESPSTSSVASSTTNGSMSGSPSSTIPTNSSPSIFDPNSDSNNAVYYSQTVATDGTSLVEVCQDPDIDIIILAFLNHLTNPPSSSSNDSGNSSVSELAATIGYPTLNLGPNCWTASAAQIAAGASTLLDCVSDGFADQISQCQTNYGKVVMLSLGGAQGYSDTTLTSDDEAAEVAQMIWDLFLGGGNDSFTQGIRPFGDIVLDGIDVDNESGTMLYMDTLMSTLRNLFATDQSHRYYLSAAPQCPRPDASIPLVSMQTQTDFVWVQFYNNPQCNLDSGASFTSSLEAWSNDLQANITGFVNIGNGVTAPKLFVGALAFAGGSGFVDNGEELRSILEGVQALNLTNLGGVMWWDGSYELQTALYDANNETFAQIVEDVFN